jgi:hypothetical protein
MTQTIESETRSARMRDRWQDPVQREILICAMRGKKYGKRARANMSKAQRARKKSPAELKRLANMSKRMAKDPVWREINRQSKLEKYRRDPVYRAQRAAHCRAIGKLGGRPRKAADTAPNQV